MTEAVGRPPDGDLATVDTQASPAPGLAPDVAGQGNAEEWLGSERHGLAAAADDDGAAATRIRLVYQKVDRARFLGNRELATAFVRASRRAGLPLAFSSGHHPLPRMSFGPALSLGFASLGEYLDLELMEARPAEEVMHALNGELPDGLTIVEAEMRSLDAPTIDRVLQGFTYSVSLDRLPAARLPEQLVDERLAAFACAPSFPIAKTIKGRTRTIDARRSASVIRSGPRSLQVETLVTIGGTLKPHHVVGELLGLSDLERQLLGVTKIGTTLTDSTGPRRSTAADATAVPCPS
jgi:radical SAM-linked protein